MFTKQQLNTLLHLKSVKVESIFGYSYDVVSSYMYTRRFVIYVYNITLIITDDLYDTTDNQKFSDAENVILQYLYDKMRGEFFCDSFATVFVAAMTDIDRFSYNDIMLRLVNVYITFSAQDEVRSDPMRYISVDDIHSSYAFIFREYARSLIG